MHKPDFLSSIPRKFILILSAIVIVIVIVFFIWQHNKYRMAKEKISSTIAEETDNIYKVLYDSIQFDEISGRAYVENIHITPDTSMIKNKKPEDLPYVLLDIRIASLRVSGVKTARALWGKQMIGDSVVIDRTDVIVYFVKPLQKQTRIVVEAKALYDEILGNLKSIQVGHVFINSINVTGTGFFTKEKDFDLLNSNIQLTDVLVDSAHNLDTSRTLFCKQAVLEVASFISYNNNRPEIRVDKMYFSGKDKSLSFAGISVNRFESENGDSSRLLRATGLSLKGLNTNEIVKNKDIIVDTITCKHITLYQPPGKKLKTSDNTRPKQTDSSGFRRAYSIDLKHLAFTKVDYIPEANSGYALGNIAVKINGVKADEIIKVQNYPMDFSKEVEINCDKISINSKDGFYNYAFQNAVVNSLRKEFKIGSVIIKPFLGEQAFANKAHFQRDRYDIVLRGIALKNVDMKSLADEKIKASGLLINNASVKIYCDLQKPMDGKSKVGRYPPQLLKKIVVPIHISQATISNAFLQYREKETLSDSTGDAKFTETSINITNITNVPEIIKKNNMMRISFESKLLGAIPLKGSFTFFHDDAGGRFTADGHVSSFDARLLNEVSVPMALIRLKSGMINSMDLDLTGDNLRAGGKLVMKYSDLRVDVLKRDKKSNDVKKKGLKSLIANIIVKNNNPGNGDLREVNPHYDRNVQKSFFNLVWKTIFTGMKKTVGMP
jgi:hypothetical protein